MALTNFPKDDKDRKVFLKSQGGGSVADPATPYQAQMIGGEPLVLLDGVEANVTKATSAASAATWPGGVATLLAYTDDGSDGGSWGSGTVKIWIKNPSASKWIQLRDAAGELIAITEDKALTLTLAKGVQIIASLEGATSPDPITVELL